MRFICDVHISIKVAKRLKAAGCDCSHVNQLPEKWNTPDEVIARVADSEDRILITKDSDFRSSNLINGSPRKLIKVNLGNIPNDGLVALLLEHLSELQDLNRRKRFLVEVDHDRLSVILLES